MLRRKKKLTVDGHGDSNQPPPAIFGGPPLPRQSSVHSPTTLHGQSTPTHYPPQPPTTYTLTVNPAPISGVGPHDELILELDLHIDTTDTTIIIVLYPEGDLDVYRDGHPAFIRRVDEEALHAYEHIRQQIANTGRIF